MHIKRNKTLAILMVLFISFFICSPTFAVSLKGKKVLIDGDSLARGAHATVHDGYYSYGDYFSSLGAKVNNIAVSSARFYYPDGGKYKIANHLSKTVKKIKYDYIVLQGGDNDVDHYSGNGNTVKAIESYFKTVSKNSKWKNAQKFFVITPHMDRGSTKLNQANRLWKKVRSLCSKYSIKCINFFKISKNDGNTVPAGFNYNLMSNRISYSQNATVEGSVDGGHPSQKAHQTMGKIIAKKFKTKTSSNKNNSSSTSSSKNNSKSTTSTTTSTSTTPESTYDGSVDTNFFGHIQDDSNGCGVFMLLNLIIDILTFGIAIAATIGVAVSGITYLTAKDNEQQTTKAKRRIYEIVIGLVAYAVLYAALKFLLPGGFNSNQTCAKTIDTTISQQKTA